MAQRLCIDDLLTITHTLVAHLIALLQSKELYFLEEVPKGLLMLISLCLQRLHCLREGDHLLLQTCNLRFLTLAGLAAEHLLHISIKDSTSVVPKANQLTFLGQFLPRADPSGPSLDSSDGLSEMLESRGPCPYDVATEERLYSGARLVGSVLSFGLDRA